MKNYILNPQLWAFVNFDGEHYLAIAHEGYKPLTYFFFPLYPLVVRFTSPLNSLYSQAITGILLSHIFIFFALIGLYKLIKLDFKTKIAKLTILLILLFFQPHFILQLFILNLFS